MTELTQQDIAPLPDRAQCYRAVGKMFLGQPKSQVLQYLDANVRSLQTQQGDARQKMAYLETKLQAQQQNLEELQKQQSRE
mmetsp:Transcript_22914/g.63783  ORF Transcript_22914/g.63783 Transcript_22914/m.63783 type:complete len:81 (-) Transcript_22914:15-257(-)